MTPSLPVLDDAQVLELLPRIEILAELRAMFVALRCGRAVQPPQTLTQFPEGAGDFITYAGMQGDAGVFGVKLSPYIVQSPRPLITAWTLLMSASSGAPLMLCDAKRLTTERTAGTTTLAVDLLAPPTARRLTVVGAGPIAEAHLRHAMALRDWEDIRVTSPSMALRPAEAFRRLTDLDERVHLCAATDEAVLGADVILLCTSAGTPVLDPSRLRDPALITSISTNAPRAHEIPPASLGRLNVYCDYRVTAPLSAGEMLIARDEHGWSADDILGDLPELTTGAAAPPDPQRHTFFRSIGLGLEDIAVANALFAAIPHAMTSSAGA